MKRTEVRVQDEVDGDVVAGHIEGRTFIRTVHPSTMLRTRRAYLLHDSTLDLLVDAGVEVIVLKEPNRRLVSTIEDWQELGIDYNGPRGAQRSLAVSLMGVQ